MSYMIVSFTGLTLADIYSVELIGGATRIPAIKEIIGNMFKRELSTTLNLDEAVSRGCALQCAMLSPTFKVRDFSVTDIQFYPVQLKWQTAMDGEVG
jgi:molecular chaperone DnaK (HSP70)